MAVNKAWSLWKKGWDGSRSLDISVPQKNFIKIMFVSRNIWVQAWQIDNKYLPLPEIYDESTLHWYCFWFLVRRLKKVSYSCQRKLVCNLIKVCDKVLILFSWFVNLKVTQYKIERKNFLELCGQYNIQLSNVLKILKFLRIVMSHYKNITKKYSGQPQPD